MQLAFCVFKVFEFGGISRDLKKITHECLARGHDVRIYTLKWQTSAWNGEAWNEVRGNEETQPSRLEVVTADVRAFTNHERYARFAKWVAEHLERHPVDLVVGFNKMPGLDVYYAGDSCFEEKARTQRGWYYRMLPRYHRLAELERGVFGAEHLTKIFTIAPAQMPIFQQHYETPEHRFFPLPPGIEKDRVASEDVDVRAEQRHVSLPAEAPRGRRGRGSPGRSRAGARRELLPGPDHPSKPGGRPRSSACRRALALIRSRLRRPHPG